MASIVLYMYTKQYIHQYTAYFIIMEHEHIHY